MSKLHLFLVTYLGLHSLALPVFASFRYLTFAWVSCMRQGMLTLSGAPSTTSQIGY